MVTSVVPGRPKYLGFVVALVGFALTRFIVLESVRQEGMTVGFLVGDGPFLVVGLAVTAFGIALVVSEYSYRDVAVVTAWCLLGTGAAGLVVASAVAEAHFAGMDPSMTGERLLPRVLIGGAAVGVVLGLRSAATGRQSRRLSGQADRLTLLNRILRHEVLNRVNVIRGYSSLDSESISRSRLDTIERSAEDIEAAIEEVGVLTRTSGPETTVERVDLVATIRQEIDRVKEAHPDARFEVDLPADATVRAVGTVGFALGHLVENAVVHNDDERPVVAVSVSLDGDAVRVRVTDDGPGLPPEQRRMLESGTLPEFDDPRAGFGLTIARMLVEQSNGTIEAVETESGTELSVTFGRAGEHATTPGVEPGALVDVTVASIVAGTLMGLLLQAATGNIAVIGALYGVADIGVGWLTHLFHSVVFGVGFVAAFSGRRLRQYRDSPLGAVAVGVGYGVLLWLVAAGFVMPVWLNAVGVDAAVPTLNAVSLAGHTVWGAVLGGGFVAVSARRE